MALDYDAAARARDKYVEQAARFEKEAAVYRGRAATAASPDEKRSFMEAAKGLDLQVAQVRQMADSMQQQITDAAAQSKALTFEESMAEARERGRLRGRGDEGLEI